MRDLTLSGTTTDQRYVEVAQQRLARIPGVRSVSTNVTLAPMAAPYRLEASLSDGKIALSGGVPDETAWQILLDRAGLEQGGLQLRAGMPERRAWVAGAQFAIDQLHFLDQGESTLSDLRVDLSCRAKSERDFRDLLIVLRAGPPAGVTLGTSRSPRRWCHPINGVPARTANASRLRDSCPMTPWSRAAEVPIRPTFRSPPAWPWSRASRMVLPIFPRRLSNNSQGLNTVRRALWTAKAR
ncbi:MAG: hypothetical protein MO852_07880 [Candidatus Devosia euplotis]|nr:hypothetical protein [Candidatus Devosia euplotis]